MIALSGLMRADDLPDWFRGQTWEEPPLTIRTGDRNFHSHIQMQASLLIHESLAYIYTES